MHASSRRLVGLVAIGSVVLGPLAWGLPKEGEPIDASKRAPISTTDAVKPSAKPVAGNGVIGGRVIRMSEVPLRRSSLDNHRAAVDVRETRKKDRVKKPSARAITARKFDVRRAADRPAAIPRIDAERFRRMLREYERDRVPAADMVNGDVSVDTQTAGMGEINRFVNPRAALEAQGIPVRSAGSGDARPAGARQVPVSQEKNAGGTSTSANASAPAAE